MFISSGSVFIIFILLIIFCKFEYFFLISSSFLINYPGSNFKPSKINYYLQKLKNFSKIRSKLFLNIYFFDRLFPIFK